jgi:hypothetical protein
MRSKISSAAFFAAVSRRHSTATWIRRSFEAVSTAAFYPDFVKSLCRVVAMPACLNRL